MDKIDIKRTLQSHYEILKSIIQNENLVSLNDYQYNNQTSRLLTTLHLIEGNLNFPKFNFVKVKEDLINCNADLRLFTGLLFVYQPFINNPTKEFKFRKTGKEFKYFQNMEDWLYSAYVSCCYEKLYNFWDRIGDILAFTFDLNIKEYDVNFAKAIDCFGNSERDYIENENFIFLKNFKNEEFESFNSVRRDIVHYYQFETTYKDDFYSAKNSEKELKTLWEKKKNLPIYFKKQLEFSIKGFDHLLNLVDSKVKGKQMES